PTIADCFALRKLRTTIVLTPSDIRANTGPVADTLMRMAGSPTLSDVEGGLEMPLLEAMLTQRAIRRLRPDPLDDAIVLRCIEIALKAPTSSNGQNWEWIVVKDQAVKQKLAAQYRPAWALYGRAMRRRSRGDDSAARTFDAVYRPVRAHHAKRGWGRNPSRPFWAPALAR